MDRVVVVGATGNVGTSVVRALSESEEVGEIVGLARREPEWRPPRTVWRRGDVLGSNLPSLFDGADAVIHLAWAIQPSRDPSLLRRINVEGSRRLFEAVAAAEVPKLLYASSVGAYAKGPKDREVGEDWPIGGTPTSFYARHKTEVEELLDDFEKGVSATKVVRMRPALIFKGEAASEIRRLFAGPFLPGFAIRSGLVPLLPRIRGLRFQAVHSADVGRAFAQAVQRDVSGAFNLAAPPPIGSEQLADLFDARTFPVAPGLIRALTDLTWHLRLQPTPPGWLDMALEVPLMSSERARRELGWEPRYTGLEALTELLEGIRGGRGFPTPPLRESDSEGRAQEVRSGVGTRQ